MKRLLAFIRWSGLACCLVLVAAWAWDCFVNFTTGFKVDEDGNTCFISMCGGGFEYVYTDLITSVELAMYPEILQTTVYPHPPTLDVPWFEVESESYRDLEGSCFTPGGTFYYRLSIPIWPLLLAAAMPTGIVFWRASKRIPPGHCQKCGYNLTGNVSGICPECGSKIHARAG